MPKSKLRGHRGGHALPRGKGSVYQRTQAKRMDERELEGARTLTEAPLTEEESNTPGSS